MMTSIYLRNGETHTEPCYLSLRSEQVCHEFEEFDSTLLITDFGLHTQNRI